MSTKLKIVVIGGAGLIGKKLIPILQGSGHEVVAASRSTAVDVLSGAGLDAALAGADVLVDVSNSPSFDDEPVMHFFRTGTGNLTDAAARAGVRHYVALSVVGTDRMQASGYFRAKLVQEQLIERSGIPYTIARATQFQEFVGAIVDSATQGNVVRLPSATLQPIAADDVAELLADVVTGAPVNGLVELAGPEAIPLDELGRRFLASVPGDARTVQTDLAASYFGTPITDATLTPTPGLPLHLGRRAFAG